jgi:hypothetical protein
MRWTVVDHVVDAASSLFGVRLELPNRDYRLPAGLKCKVRLPSNQRTGVLGAVIAYPCPHACWHRETLSAAWALPRRSAA